MLDPLLTAAQDSDLASRWHQHLTEPCSWYLVDLSSLPAGYHHVPLHLMLHVLMLVALLPKAFWQGPCLGLHLSCQLDRDLDKRA